MGVALQSGFSYAAVRKVSEDPSFRASGLQCMGLGQDLNTPGFSRRLCQTAPTDLPRARDPDCRPGLGEPAALEGARCWLSRPPCCRRSSFRSHLTPTTLAQEHSVTTRAHSRSHSNMHVGVTQIFAELESDGLAGHS